jgi:hypothetical protein
MTGSISKTHESPRWQCQDLIQSSAAEMSSEVLAIVAHRRLGMRNGRNLMLLSVNWAEGIVGIGRANDENIPPLWGDQLASKDFTLEGWHYS